MCLYVMPNNKLNYYYYYYYCKINDINNVGVQIFLVSKLSIETSLIFVCFVSDYGNKSETKKKIKLNWL